MYGKAVLLIGFYNQKALGVRYLEKALASKGYNAHILFFKGFSSVKPRTCTTYELELLCGVIRKILPGLIGLSVMSSFYLDTVIAVNEAIRKNFNIPVIWGGVYPTLFPKECLEYADYVIRGEGEDAVIEVADAVFNNKPCTRIQNLVYKHKDRVVINELRPLCRDLDKYDFPGIGGSNKYYIDNNAIVSFDPQLMSHSYELTASRGCPFSCSYCSSINLRRLYKGKGPYVRFRDVPHVIEELIEAKRKMKKLKYIRFWDEIFSNNKKWIDNFCAEYSKHINIPFEIWSHPKMVNTKSINALVDAGLSKVVIGIQSGSDRIRKDIFNRTETREEIIDACNILHSCKVPSVVYDFMLKHPFEHEEDIQKTYELCAGLINPFKLQLHGLNFLPGTDIVEMAAESGIFDRVTLEKMMCGPMQEQYNIYWGSKKKEGIFDFWYSLIYLTQFKFSKPLAARLAKLNHKNITIVIGNILNKISKPLSILVNAYEKARLVFKSLA